MPTTDASMGGRTGQGWGGTERDRIPLLDGKVVDLKGPGLTDCWGVTSTDLGASVVAPNGKLVSVFGDTFSGRRVGDGERHSPVVLIGIGDADHEIVYERAGGSDPDFAHQLWHYSSWGWDGPRWGGGSGPRRSLPMARSVAS
jgi:hypothetical protein